MDVITRWLEDGVAILLPGTAVIDAKGMARRWRDSIARCEGQSPGGPRLSMSMGLAEGIEGNDANRVLHRAWLALDSAQSAGPGTIFVHDGAKSIPVKALAGAR
jgi:GGDEF domain-containing protein